MIALVLAAAVSQSVPADPAPTPAPTYTVADVIGRNPDDVCALAFHSGHWSDWLKGDAAVHHANRRQFTTMLYYCDGFIHGMAYKGE